MTADERTYCEECSVNFDDDGFDYRFERPVCHSCVEKLGLTPTEDDANERWAVYILDLMKEQRSDPELGRLIHRAFHGADSCEGECTLKERAEIRELVAYMKNFWLTGLCRGFIPPHAYEAVRQRVRALDEAE